MVTVRWPRGRDQRFCQCTSGTGVARTQLATGEHRVVGRVFDLSTRRYFDNFQRVTGVGRVFVAAHNQHVPGALVVIGAGGRRIVAKTVKFKPLS